MIVIGDKLISLDILEEEFTCNLDACMGACCVEGDAGAPLEESELETLDKIWPEVEPYLPAKGVEAIKLQGTSVQEGYEEYATPLVDGKECAFTVFEKGKALCGIEKAFFDGKIKFRKPISCQLYPIRVRKMLDMEALNYDKWEICSPACELGKKRKMPVYMFLKDALVRRYGIEFYEELDDVAADFKNEKL